MTTQQPTDPTPGLPAPIARMRTGSASDEILALIIGLRENGGLPEGVKPDGDWGSNSAVGWYLKDKGCLESSNLVLNLGEELEHFE